MTNYEERFETGIAYLRRYVAAQGSSSPPQGATIDGFLIGSWVDSRRTEYRRGRLSAERIRRIEIEFPAWRWSVHDAQFDVGLAHLRRYVATHGTSRVVYDEVVDGFAIGTWVQSRRADYRTGRLSGERVALFEREFPDWQWSPQAAASAVAFETGIAHLHRYVAVNGTSNARRRDVIDGFAIGTWVQSRRADYRTGRLLAERIRRIETEFPDWQWTIRTSSTPGPGR
ncbi:helicase associated domain-containing protein [Gordonia sp. 'Campus']|uniref:helicase associated domain-containing protein n=1 Tax=Gordonia sp. 'Campus' TaxID=2915824 RepID=UPI001EE43940|nr:helicase associated domain-containing protein [Gordonia sp. 'Campus']